MLVTKDAHHSHSLSLTPRSCTAVGGWSLGREAGLGAGPLSWGPEGPGGAGGGFGKLVPLPVCAFLPVLECSNLGAFAPQGSLCLQGCSDIVWVMMPRCSNATSSKSPFLINPQPLPSTEPFKFPM